MAGPPIDTPPAGTLERWCFDLVTTRDLEDKLSPPSAPRVFERDPVPRRLGAPGRPPTLVVAARAPRTPRPGALARPAARAALLHAMAHHELQAAELFAWAVLTFPRTPRAFRAGLARLAEEELAHLALYGEHLARLGSGYGRLPVRDWFWERVATCTTPASFVALQGLGLEAANLEHSARFARRFRELGDEHGARLLERIERDEVRHVAFAARWFERFSGAPLDYDRWRAALPDPLTPGLFRGAELNEAARRAAGISDPFLRRLEAEPPAHRSRARS